MTAGGNDPRLNPVQLQGVEVSQCCEWRYHITFTEIIFMYNVCTVSLVGFAVTQRAVTMSAFSETTFYHNGLELEVHGSNRK